MIITKEFIESGGTNGIGFTNEQLRVLGFSSPPGKGWKSELIGKEIPDEVAQKFVSMKGVKRKRIPPRKPKDKDRDTTCEFIGKYLSFPRKIVDIKKEIEVMKSYKLKGDLVPYLIRKEMSYDQFLSSPYWKVISAYKKLQAGYRCQLCNSSERLAVHHRTYENHGYEIEHLDDLVVLCERCHSKFHGKER